MFPAVIIEGLAVVTVALLTIYIFSTLAMNIYINLDVKSVGILVVLSAVLGMFIMAYILGSGTWILVSFFLTLFLLIVFTIRRRGKRKRQAQTGGNN
jgi:F0F1-type ATP synthase assembly protein I